MRADISFSRAAHNAVPTSISQAAGVVPEEISGRVYRVSPLESPAACDCFDTEIYSATPGEPQPTPASCADESAYADAQKLANLLEEFQRLRREEGMTLVAASKQLGRAPTLFSGANSKLAQYLRGGVAALVRARPGRRSNPAGVSELLRQIEALDWFIPAARYFYLHTNRNAERGSVPEAVRRVICLPDLPAGWRDEDRERFARAIKHGQKEIDLKLALTPALSPRERGNCPLSTREAEPEILSGGSSRCEKQLDHENPAQSSAVENRQTQTRQNASPLLGERVRVRASLLVSPARTPVRHAPGEAADFTSEIPTFPPSLRALLLARERAGQPLVPPRIARQIALSPALVRHHRNPKSAALDYLNAAGSMFFFHDPLTGERRPPRPGEVIEADDATINFPVCVPWTLGGDPCSDRFGVKVGRFQWLVSIDAARRFVTAWTYVMRPRASYRGEDALSLMRAHCRQHGVPLQWRFERGVWNCHLVRDAIDAMGSHLHTVWSPHQKPYIEGLFNTLWTKLSVHFPGADVGRFRGETEEANRLLAACRNGQRDPRRHFPMLNDALAAFAAVIDEKNRTPVNSQIGRWIPAEAWAARDAKNIRRLDASSEWIFAAYTREWTVSGMNVGGRVRLFEDLAVPFDFYADWLVHFKGARVRVHFDPAATDCRATIVLLQNWNSGGHAHRHRAGDVLGTAEQINDVAGYARLVLGWAEDSRDAGRLARQRAETALRRETRAITGTRVRGANGVREKLALTPSLSPEERENRLLRSVEAEHEIIGSNGGNLRGERQSTDFSGRENIVRLEEISLANSVARHSAFPTSRPTANPLPGGEDTGEGELHTGEAAEIRSKRRRAVEDFERTHEHLFS